MHVTECRKKTHTHTLYLSQHQKSEDFAHDNDDVKDGRDFFENEQNC